jgi:putative endonuclease
MFYKNQNNIKTGKDGEQLAATFLQNNGYTLLAINWRHHHWELDIIAAIGKTLHFVEVKTRTSLLFGYPEEHISAKKMRHLKNAACHYHYLHPNYKNIQFDVISVMIELGNEPVIYFIEDVYF